MTNFKGHEIEAKGRKLTWRRSENPDFDPINFLELMDGIVAVFSLEGMLLVVDVSKMIYRIDGWETWDDETPYSGLRVAGVGRLEIW